MPDGTAVTLHVRYQPTEGYSAAPVSKMIPPGGADHTFYYRFTGGNQPGNDGSFIFPPDGQARTVTIDLDAPPSDGWTFYFNPNFSYVNPGTQQPGASDLQVVSTTFTRITLSDSDVDEVEGEYSVVAFAKDGANHFYTILCDPQWGNRPGK